MEKSGFFSKNQGFPDTHAPLRPLEHQTIYRSEQDIEVIGEAEDGQAAIGKAKELTPEFIAGAGKQFQGVTATHNIMHEHFCRERRNHN